MNKNDYEKKNDISLAVENHVLSKHAMQRMQQRNFNQAEILYAIRNGRLLRRNGLKFYFLAEKDIPDGDIGKSWSRRLSGLIVLMDCQGDRVITVYRDYKGLRAIKKLPRYRYAA